MSTPGTYEQSKKISWLPDDKISESRPITPPCRKVLREPVAEGLLVLPPEPSSIHFNSDVKKTLQTAPTRRSADRVERKLQSVKSIERSNSAGGRLTEEKCHSCSGTPHEENIVVTSFKEKVNEKEICNGDSVEEHDDNSDHDVPIELTAEFLGCVMKEDFKNALCLCEEIVAVDPKNKTCLEFQDLIKEKLRQDEQSNGSDGDDDSENDEDDEDDDDGEEEREEEDEDDDEEDDGDDDEEDNEEEDRQDTEESSEGESDDEESNESSSESDAELPVGSINLLMGGLPLRPVSRSSEPNYCR